MNDPSKTIESSFEALEITLPSGAQLIAADQRFSASRVLCASPVPSVVFSTLPYANSADNEVPVDYPAEATHPDCPPSVPFLNWSEGNLPVSDGQLPVAHHLLDQPVSPKPSSADWQDVESTLDGTPPPPPTLDGTPPPPVLRDDLNPAPITTQTKSRPNIAEMGDIQGFRIKWDTKAKKQAESMRLDDRLVVLMESLFTQQHMSLFADIKNLREMKGIDRVFADYVAKHADLAEIYNQLNQETKLFLGQCSEVYKRGGGIVLKEFLDYPGIIIGKTPNALIFRHADEVRKYPSVHLQKFLEYEAGVIMKRLRYEGYVAGRGMNRESLISRDGRIIGVRYNYAGGANIYESLVPENNTHAVSLQEKIETMRDLLAYIQDQFHSHDIVHRDLKPDNIMIDDDTHQPRPIDYGHSRPIQRTETVTGKNDIVGTPTHMAPEQARSLLNMALNRLPPDEIQRLQDQGYQLRPPLTEQYIAGICAQDVKKCSPAVDVYALGILFYQLLTGELPYPEIQTLHGLGRHILGRVYTYPKVIPAIPDVLQSIIFKAIDLYPENRYANAAEFLAALNSIEL